MTFQKNRHAHAWLCIASIPKVSPGEWLKLLTHYVTMDALLEQGAAQNPAIAQRLKTINLRWVARAENWLAQREEHTLVCYGDEAYPSSLKELTHPPLILFVTGKPACLAMPQLAIVGSRRASHVGTQTATRFAQQLCHAGLGVTSGLACGIDAAAHRGALAAGSTIAVMGTGPDTVYPARHRKLHDQIVEAGGAVVSEFFPGVGPRPYHFPRRNRIIAGLSLGTLVVEATIKSGTLITANLAADLGKEVFAVPGSILHDCSSGCHHLIQQGAMLVTSCNDILETLGLEACTAGADEEVVNEKSEANCLATDKLLASVNFDVTAIDVIAERNALPVHEVMATLLEYELRGWVAAVPGGYVKLRGK